MDVRERRRRLASEAARLMALQHIADAGVARRKAARLLHITDRDSQPGEDEIRRELAAYLALFHPAHSKSAARAMREAAREAMAFFRHFDPRLAGDALDGIALAGSAIVLHLHADEAEAVPRFLEEAGIPSQPRYRRMRLQGEPVADFPCWTFIAGGHAIELVVLPPLALRHPPLDGDGRPMARTSAMSLSALLESAAGSDDG